MLEKLDAYISMRTWQCTWIFSGYDVYYKHRLSLVCSMLPFTDKQSTQSRAEVINQIIGQIKI